MGRALVVETNGATAAKLVAQDSRFMECGGDGVFLGAFGTGTATGLLSNCAASACGNGFALESASSANVDVTLTNCRASGNLTGLNPGNINTGNATMRLAN